jgi:small subunit ribosomal protein S13
MVVFFGAYLPSSTPLGKALRAVVGVGPAYAKFLSHFFGLSLAIPLQEVPREILKNLVRKTSQERLILLALRRETSNAVRLKSQLRLYQGVRHNEGLPVRGQNTKTNASTSRKLRLLGSAVVKK